MKILVTGAAGFIGFHLARRLVERGDAVVGLDNINDYYDVNLKYARLAESGIEGSRIIDRELVTSSRDPHYRFIKIDLIDDDGLARLLEGEKFDIVCHMAAQAGVRYSIVNPRAYVDSNFVGFANIVELCRLHGVKHLVYASSASVYGLNEKVPFSTHDNVDHPVSLYAASKKSNELVAHSYSHLFGLPTTGLRFFTVYGPWGRPDMAYFLFTRAILEGRPIDAYNSGEMRRDFTYIDDIIEGVVRVVDRPPGGDPHWSGRMPDPGSSKAPYRIFNIGCGQPVRLLDFIGALEKALDRKARVNLLPIQPGDVPVTWADVSDFQRNFGFRPAIPIEDGITRFVQWYLSFHHREG